MSEKLKNILTVLLIWTILGLLYSLQSYYYRIQLGQDSNLLSILLVDTPYFLFWALFTPVPLYFSARFPFVKTSWLRFLFIHFSLAMFAALFHSLIYNIYRLLVHYDESVQFTWNRVYLNAIGTFDYGMLVYFVVLLVINVFDYYKRFQQERTQNAELQTALVKSQLNALKMKLQPHFLFNTLNSIQVLIKENPRQADMTVKQLSNLLRHVLKNVDEQFTDLQKEIDFISQYLAIEQVRFGERLHIKMDVDSELLNVPVPSLILQPLVENAVRHGVAQKRGKSVIEIKITKNDNDLYMHVFDNGKGYEPAKAGKGSGLGLQITQERLKSIYNSRCKLLLSKAPEGGTNAVIQIPLPKEFNG